MPHSTHPSPIQVPTFKSPLDANNISHRNSMEKFPDISDYSDGTSTGQSTYPSSPIMSNGYSNGHPPIDRWSKKDTTLLDTSWANGQTSAGNGKHSRQKSLGEAFNTMRTRKASVSANVAEISGALKAPVSPKLIILCLIWYMSSALTNTSSKSILNAFPKPATLTLMQFIFVVQYCILFSWLASKFPALARHVPALRHGIRYPTKDVIMTTLPIAAFQVAGHLLSSNATSKIPVSLVHTIKGLSPLFTVFAYRLVFDIRYPIATYLSLIPLTMGVMLACSAEFKGNFFGILYAFLAAIIFVTQNIYSKRLFNEAAAAEASGTPSRKLDKLNLLCYSSGLAYLATFPIWFWSEGLTLLQEFLSNGTLSLARGAPSGLAMDHGDLAREFAFNGMFHFGQNIIAFILLSMVSPVTYSVASLIKRVFVVVIAIIWFQNPTTNIQGVGIALTFFGLYLYDRTKSNKADQKAIMLHTKEDSLLPTSNTPARNSPAPQTLFEPPQSKRGLKNSYAFRSSMDGQDDKKSDDPPHSSNGVSRGGRGRATSNVIWLPPGTRQEETWRPREINGGPPIGIVSAS